MGFLDPSSVGQDALEPLHPLVATEDRWAEQAGKYAVQLVRNRLRGMLWHVESYPGMFAVFLGGSPE
eukprot:10536347-Lingulodinium_polyedra.AAC.1